MAKRIVVANGVELCVETFGQRSDPAILLVMGAGASMDWWEDEFCERLAAGSRLVVRFDLRDTGQSTSYEAGAPPYTARDLLDDAVGLLDALELASAHIVGISMGGAIAQLLALDHSDRVASLTLISTSPAEGDRRELPSMSEETAARFAIAEPDWSDRSAVIEYMVELGRVAASPSRRFDEAAYRDLVRRALDRTKNVAASVRNHNLIAGGEPPTRRLGQLEVPTLVVHGVDDPVLPLEHGRALADEIPHARLLPLERTGHELPREAWDIVAPAILEHTDRP